MRQMNRRSFLRKTVLGAAGAFAAVNTPRGECGRCSAADGKRPNILLVMSDDQSWPHASAYGCRFVKTPNFDRVARDGVLFSHAYCAAPGCSPSRAALLTGRHIWQIEEAAAHASLFPKKLTVYPDLLAEAGYHVGLTGKGWGPGTYDTEHNPAGPMYSDIKLKPPYKSMSNIDYAANFAAFLEEKKDKQSRTNLDK